MSCPQSSWWNLWFWRSLVCMPTFLWSSRMLALSKLLRNSCSGKAISSSTRSIGPVRRQELHLQGVFPPRLTRIISSKMIQSKTKNSKIRINTQKADWGTLDSIRIVAKLYSRHYTPYLKALRIWNLTQSNNSWALCTFLKTIFTTNKCTNFLFDRMSLWEKLPPNHQNSTWNKQLSKFLSKFHKKWHEFCTTIRTNNSRDKLCS